MENLKINYVCLALSILCLLLVSCKDDEAYPYPAGKELLNYEMPMYIIAGDGQEPIATFFLTFGSKVVFMILMVYQQR